MTKYAQEFRGLAADSREVKPGFLFAALAGTKTDGARFIEDAVRRGAVAVLGGPDAASAVEKLGVSFIPASNPRQRLAELAAEFYRDQPACIAAVTGTNGKTSVASFLRQIWATCGKPAASLGTIGIESPSGHVALGHTTPDPIRLHAELARLKREGVDCLALEASSHGLDQFRLDGVRITAAAFTNITRDHLDYHPTFEAYLAAKMRLFTDLMKPGGLAVINADGAHAEAFIQVAKQHGLRLLTVGKQGEALRLTAQKPHIDGQILTLLTQGREHSIALPLAGLFQASNALVAAGLALGLDEPADKIFAALAELKGAPGRLELVARNGSGAPIYVDYAHTPDAIETVLLALRPHVQGHLNIVFGCGGDRDRGKRPLMAKAALAHADGLIITDDNPRTEDAAAIRAEVRQGAPSAREIAGRAEAIAVAVEALKPGDALVIAGKGHEDYQIVGDVVHPFSDRDEAIKAAVKTGGQAQGVRP